MLRVGIAGIGSMGRVHLDRYCLLMQEGAPVSVTAIFDINKDNYLKAVEAHSDLKNQINYYDDFAKMIDYENLDAVDIVLPDYLHCECSCYALLHGVHVLCEKPMALSAEDTDKMLQVSQKTGNFLMIAHCCRYMEENKILKNFVESGELGLLRMANFYRMSSSPVRHSLQNWYLDQNKSGGCIMDMHIHDIDLAQWIFGMPEAISALGLIVSENAGIDCISAQYRYPGFVVHLTSDWSLAGKAIPFMSGYSAHFEGGTVFNQDGIVTLYKSDAEPVILHGNPEKDSYFEEIKTFIHCLEGTERKKVSNAFDAALAVKIALLEEESVRLNGKWKEITDSAFKSRS